LRNPVGIAVRPCDPASNSACPSSVTPKQYDKAMKTTLLALATVICFSAGAGNAQGPPLPSDEISPMRPVPAGKAPHMQVKLLKDSPEEKVYVVVFLKGDEVLSGLTDFALKYKVGDAHFTGIGAISSATTA